MNYAPVVPPKMATTILKGINTGASFAYAPFAQDNEAYRKFFTGRPGLVLDNPIYESYRGLSTSNKPDSVEPVTPKALATLCNLMNPTFAFMPDIVDDMPGTLRLAQGYIQATAHPSLAAVIQGRNMSMLMECGREFYLSGIRRFGISVFTPRHFGIGREMLTAALVVNAFKSDEDVKIHWLGADYPYDEQRMLVKGAWPNLDRYVVSCDSAEAFNATYDQVRNLTTYEEAVRTRPAGFYELEGIGEGYDWYKEAADVIFRSRVQEMQKWFTPVI